MNNSISVSEKIVKVVPTSNKYERQDIETAVNDAYNDGYVIERLVRSNEYIFLYFKQVPLV